VLDHEQFVPLAQRLDWLNFNLRLRTSRHKGVEILEAISDVLDEEQILSAAQAEVTGTRTILDAVLRLSAEETAKVTGSLIDMLTARAQALTTQGMDTHKRIRVAQDKLRELVNARQRLEHLASESDALLTTGTSAAQRTEAEIDRLLESARRAIARAQQVQEAADWRLERLTGAYDDLKGRLRKRASTDTSPE